VSPGSRATSTGTRGAVRDLRRPVIAHPLRPFRDLLRDPSPALKEAITAGAAPHELHGLLLAELGLPRWPTVVVIEDALGNR
jgi:hypothetical protein